MNGADMKICLNLLLISFCIACTSNTSDEKIIVGQRMTFNAAIARQDLSKMEEYCADDIIVVTSRNTKFLNREQYAGGLQQEFNSKDDLIYVRTPESIKVFPAWEMAAESGLWVGKWKVNDESTDIKGTYYAKWKKSNGQWLITTEVFTPLKCTGGVYCVEYGDKQTGR